MKIMVLLLLTLFVGCDSYCNEAYPHRNWSNCYVVRMSSSSSSSSFVDDPYVSKCLSLEEATKLANQINNDVNGRWSGQ